MDANQFDDLSRALAAGVSRRGLLKLGAALVSAAAAMVGMSAEEALVVAKAPPCKRDSDCAADKRCCPPTSSYRPGVCVSRCSYATPRLANVCARQTFEPSEHVTKNAFIGNPIVADVQFFDSLKKINTCANSANVKVHVTSSFRTPAQNERECASCGSGHLAGHAIDMNVAWPGGTRLCNKTCLAKHLKGEAPAPVAKFLSCVERSGLRWGGRFNDPVHIDDGVISSRPDSGYRDRYQRVQSPQGCKDGSACCDGRCIDVDKDENNCGACGQKCGADLKCFMGKCIARTCRNEVVVSVPARSGWQEVPVNSQSWRTGVWHTYEIVAGQWRHASEQPYNRGAGGTAACVPARGSCAKPLPSFPEGALVHRLYNGQWGPITGLGAGVVGPVWCTGSFCPGAYRYGVRINENDSQLSDNDGTLTVRICEIDKPQVFEAGWTVAELMLAGPVEAADESPTPESSPTPTEEPDQPTPTEPATATAEPVPAETPTPLPAETPPPEPTLPPDPSPEPTAPPVETPVPEPTPSPTSPADPLEPLDPPPDGTPGSG